MACILHSAPACAEERSMRDIVEELRTLAGAVFVTDLSASYYASFGASWAVFVRAMERAR